MENVVGDKIKMAEKTNTVKGFKEKMPVLA
jgi:hypothetical protein